MVVVDGCCSSPPFSLELSQRTDETQTLSPWDQSTVAGFSLAAEMTQMISSVSALRLLRPEHVSSCLCMCSRWVVPNSRTRFQSHTLDLL